MLVQDGGRVIEWCDGADDVLGAQRSVDHQLEHIGDQRARVRDAEVQGRAAQEVAEELAALEEVFAVHLVTGARDIEILVVLQELEELENFLLRDVAKIRGIGTLSAGIAADVIKYDFDRAQIA